MKTDEIRKRYLAFFKQRSHKIIKSDSLIPHNDPTLLFTGAGMNQFKEYFLGIKKDFTRATSSQKCLRTGDLDNVGRTSYHHSFFEMLGNFSFGDYFKKDAILWAWEFMTKELGISAKKLSVSVHSNDEESYEIWQKTVGIADGLIYKFGDKDNFWPSNAPQNGPNGPCGPCSEIFYDQGDNYGCRSSNCSPQCDCGRFAEVWNLVFTQYERMDGGVLEALPSKNIDTGMGLERIACVMQRKRTNYEIDIFEPLIQIIAKQSKVATDSFDTARSSVYAIADHIRAAVFAISDGAYPSNEGRGYVIRKLLRRSIWHARLIGIKKAFLCGIVPHVVTMFKDVYPEIDEHQNHVIEIVKWEEERFLNTIEDGLNLLDDVIAVVQKKGEQIIPGEDVFRLYDTFGFPDELTKLIAEKKGLSIGQDVFEHLMDEQRQRAKSAAVISDAIFTTTDLERHLSKLPKTQFCGYHAFECESNIISIIKGDASVNEISVGDQAIIVLDASPFYPESGGQVGDRGHLRSKDSSISVLNTHKKDDIYYNEVLVEKGHIRVNSTVSALVDKKRRDAIMKNHTATHLLQAALRDVLGKHVRQLGSLVSENKLRFDFSYQQALSEKQKRKIEVIVNEKIQAGINIKKEESTVSEAKSEGALAFFGDRYGDIVRVVSIGDFSKELCGGTHLENTNAIGVFKLMSESSIASGIRRIEACTGEHALQYDDEKKREEVEEKVKQEKKKKEKEVRQLRLAQAKKEVLAKVKPFPLNVQVNNATVQCILHKLDDIDQGGLLEIFDVLKTKYDHSIAVLFSHLDDRLAIVVALTKDLINSELSADKTVRAIINNTEGSGGGKKMVAFGGSKEVNRLDDLMHVVPTIIEKQINE